jgi:hypothetical protein
MLRVHPLNVSGAAINGRVEDRSVRNVRAGVRFTLNQPILQAPATRLRARAQTWDDACRPKQNAETCSCIIVITEIGRFMNRPCIADWPATTNASGHGIWRNASHKCSEV